MPERVDVCIVGSGFGGSITAFRVAELYRAAGVDPKRILVLERGRRYKHTDFRQSMYIGHLANVYNLTQSSGGPGTVGASGPQGCQMVTANAVGGGSNLYLAASLRAPSETFERRDHHPDDGPDRRMWPAELSRRSLNPFYARAERGLRVSQPTWSQVSKAGGVSAAERRGVRVRPNRQVESIRRSDPNASGYRYVVSASVMDNEGQSPPRQPTGQTEEIECKVLILAAGAMGTPPILMRSRQQLPSLSSHVGRHLSSNGDHVAA